MWPGPAGESYFGLILHGITPEYKRVELLLDFDVLGAEHTAQNQAHRVRNRARKVLGMEPQAALWMMEADNTASAANIAGLLGMQDGRCSSHIYNLSARHLLFLHERTREGIKYIEPHQSAVVAVVKLCEKVRIERDPGSRGQQILFPDLPPKDCQCRSLLFLPGLGLEVGLPRVGHEYKTRL